MFPSQGEWEKAQAAPARVGSRCPTGTGPFQGSNVVGWSDPRGSLLAA